jgi:outer membrane protein TolC
MGVARGFLLPRLSLEETATRTDNPPGVFMAKLNQGRFTQADFALPSLNNPAPVTDLQTFLAIDQPVFSGKALIGLAMARKEHSAKSEDYGRKKEETMLAVARAYLQVYTAREDMAVAQTGLDDAREHQKIAEERNKNGVGLYSDVLRAKTAVIEAEQKIVTAQKNLSVGKKALGMLAGTGESLDIAEEKLGFPLREQDYYESGAASRKDVRAMEIRSENAKNEIRLAESKYLPTVDIRAAYQMNDHSRLLGTEGESWWLLGTLQWKLFDGTVREYERSKAQYKQAETEEQLKGLRESVAFKIGEAYLSAQEAAKNAELSRAALSSAEEGQRLVRRRYENSLSPIVDLLDVQLSVDRARADVAARENEYRLAVLRIAYESGTIEAELGEK